MEKLNSVCSQNIADRGGHVTFDARIFGSPRYMSVSFPTRSES